MVPENPQDFDERDRYEILNKLGAGGVGVVYEALDRERDARVALKTLQRLDAVAISRFKNEFRALSDVVHPNLVQLYELVAQGDALFFTMELIDGVNFVSWVRPTIASADTLEKSLSQSKETETIDTVSVEHQTSPGTPSTKAQSVPGSTRAKPGPIQGDKTELDLPRLRRSMQQLAQAVAAIHRSGLLHRDLKPSNVLVTTEGRVVVLDFGLITEIDKYVAGSSESGRRVGTPAFMSPEQGANSPLGEPSDWYSVGVMLYAALTGRMPFVGGHADILMDKQQFEPPPPSQIVPNVPEDLDALCVELLRRDPERRPPGREVLRRLGVEPSTGSTASVPTGAATHTASGVLVGRDEHLAALSRALDDVDDGHAVLCNVSGASGMGKSSLVRRFLDEARAGDKALVLRGRCYERESVPFKALDSLVDSLGSYLAGLSRVDAEGLMPRDILALARLFPVLRQVEAVTASKHRRAQSPDPHELRRRAFAALRELFIRLSDRHPILLAVDDLQWGDRDSASLLAAMLTPPDAPAVLLLASYRSEEEATSDFLQTFREEIGEMEIDTRAVDVGPLSREDAISLGQLHLGDRPGAMRYVERIADESAGSPFFVEELARFIRDHAEDESVDAVSLDEVLRMRLRRLPEGAAELLETVAVAARPIPQAIAFRAAGGSDPGSLAMLKAGSFVRSRNLHGERYLETYHDRVRETTVAMLPPDRLKARHRRLAAAIEVLPQPDPEALAVHLHGAGELARAATFAALAAARAAEALAFERAARLYQMALDFYPGDGSERRSLYVGLGDALAAAGRGVDAADAYLAAAEGAVPGERLELHRRAGQALFYCGHVERALEVIGVVLDALGVTLPKTPGRAVISLLIGRLKLALRGKRFRERDESEIPVHELMRIDATRAVAEGLANVQVLHAADFGARQLLTALKVGEPKRVARALAAEAVFLSLQGAGAAKKSHKVLDQMLSLAKRLDHPDATALAIGVPGIIALNEGRWADAYQACAAANEHIRDHCRELIWEENIFGLFELYGLALSGEIGALMKRQAVLVREANERGDLHAVVGMVAGTGFYEGVVNDDPDRGYRLIEETLERWSPEGFHVPHLMSLMGLMWLDTYRGDGQSALERANEHAKVLKRSMLLRVETVRGYWYTAHGRAAVTAATVDGDPDLLRLAEKDARRLEGEKTPWGNAWSGILRAGVASIRGENKAALEALTRAEKLCADDGMRMYVHNLRRRRGVLIGGDEGNELVAAADAHMHGQGIVNPKRFTNSIVPGFRDARLLTSG